MQRTDKAAMITKDRMRGIAGVVFPVSVTGGEKPVVKQTLELIRGMAVR